MTAWHLSKSAKAALVDIYDYTADKWGSRQADSYLKGLFDSFSKIRDRKTIWRPIPDEFEVRGYFTRYKRHYIFWQERPHRTIAITAILHVSMMQGDRLASAFGTTEKE